MSVAPPISELKRLIVWTVVGTGISSVVAQLLSIREFLSQFEGNEITISLVLFTWLLIAGAGSLAAKWVKRPSLLTYIGLLFLAAVGPLLLILAVRGLKTGFFAHGVSPGFYAIFWYIVITVAPYCFLIGYILPYAQKLLFHRGISFSSGALYVTDNIGDITGGILFSFIFVYFLKPFPTIALSSVLLIIVGLILAFKTGGPGLTTMYIALSCVFFFFTFNQGLERQTLTSQYGRILRYVESPYGRIAITGEGTQKTIWNSGVPLYSDANVVKSEEKVHFPLSQLDRADHALLISGGLGETMVEIAKYHPERVDYIELDPYVIQEALRFGILREFPFLQVKTMDGRRYMRATENRYDAIILDVPEPDTFQINRFFTEEFFALAKKILNQGGVFCFGIGYSPNYISDVRAKKISSLYYTAKRVYQTVVLIPGEEVYFLCRDGGIARDIPRRLTEKSIETEYIEGSFYGNVTPDRIQQIEDTLEAGKQLNRDFEPTLMHIVFTEWFLKHGTTPKYFFLVLLVLVSVYLRFLKKEEYVLFSTGLVTMGAEMLVVFAFQVIYGYVYLKIGAIVTASLIGLLPGAFLGSVIGKTRRGLKLLSSDLLLFLFLLLFFVWITFSRFEFEPVYFLLYCFCFSFLCGAQFPLVTQMIGERNSPAAGCLAADLTGASIGTLVIGTILIPVWGFQYAVIFLMLTKASSLIMIAFNRKMRAERCQP